MEKYTHGIDMNQFEHINQISSYNYNFYNGFGKDLLLGISDDDNETEWYLCNNKTFDIIGYSYTSENEKLYLIL